MPKDSKDYLHYYVGCKFIMKITGSDKFTAEMRFGYEALCATFSGKRDELIEPILLLRPLSDMTEDEAIEVARVSEWPPHFRNPKVERNKYNDLIVTWDGMTEGGETVNATGDMFYCAEQFTYLLSKHFDLFGLIEDNLAIDKTKLK